MENSSAACLVCGSTNQDVPLIGFIFKDQQYWICPQHLPILIHKPGQLADKVPGIKTTSDA